MKGGCSGEEAEIKQKYVFFSEPERIAKCANKSGTTPQRDRIVESRGVNEGASEQQKSTERVESAAACGLKYVGSFLSREAVQSHPFTFVTAVKRKLALAAYDESTKRAYGSIITKNAGSGPNVRNGENATTRGDSLYGAIEKMDFVKPLKVPDVKISPKTLEYATKEGLNLRDLAALKVSTPVTAACASLGQKNKSGERLVHRKLDFSLSEGHSLVSSDDVEPLRTPDLTMSPSLAKQKEHARDNSREKENRNKRMKRDDTLASRTDESGQEVSAKRPKNPKHMSRRESTETKRTKAERSLIVNAKDAELLTSKKPKSKSFATSTFKKESDERRIRSSSGTHGFKGGRDRSLELRGRTFSSESLPDRCSKINERCAREQSRIIVADAESTKSGDDYQILYALRQIEDHKQKSCLESKPPRNLGRSSSSQSLQQKINDPTAKDQQHKRIQERNKASSNKWQTRAPGSASDIIEDLDNPSDSSNNRNSSDYQQNSNNVAQTSCKSTTEEIHLDPARISFRDDSYSQQEDFCDLVTPDMNLNVRPKRRKQRTTESEPDVETTARTAKHKGHTGPETESPSSEASYVHPSALHMQFQAELHLFDSYNESLRQVEGVEKCLYNARNETGREFTNRQQRTINDEARKHHGALQAERENVLTVNPAIPEERARELENDFPKMSKSSCRENESTSPVIAGRRNHKQDAESRESRPDVKVAETQTANDIATQTETRSNRHALADRPKQYPGITYERGDDFNKSDIPELSLGSLERFEDLDRTEDLSLAGKMRTMSEISLHETTSSIKTETGTEISMTTRDVTCSFNKYLDHEMAQLIKDEKLMYDKIEMLFKSREKTLNDRTKKLVKLEEQKRALRDTGQDSRVSSVKKKQRALLLKLQQEKDEMNRLKELHKIASQERKLMLEKQRNMLNPQMSTKNILTKLKRSADCQSPRRLSGPMKGYDIRSNSSMSSLLESEKAQIDRAQMDMKMLLSDSSYKVEGKSLKSDQETSAPEKLDATASNGGQQRYLDALEIASLNDLERFDETRDNFGINNSSRELESKTRKFEEKMPNSRTNYLMTQKRLLNSGQITEAQEEPQTGTRNVESVENAKSESDTLVEELSKKSKLADHEIPQVAGHLKEFGIHENKIQLDEDAANTRKSKALQVNEETLLQAYARCTKKSDKSVTLEREGAKKLQQHSSHEIRSTSKRKGGKSLKPKAGVLSENILRSKNNVGDDATKTSNNSKRTKMEKELLEDHHQSSILEGIDLNESQNSLQALVKHSRAVKDKNYKLLRDIACEQHETKENIASANPMDRSSDNRDNDSRRDDTDLQNLGNISTRSQVSTFTISRHSSGDSEKGFSRSVIIRAQDHRFKTSKKLEEALNAREAALVARRNCVEDWIAWHTKLKAEECRVARMEQAAFKLVSTAANALSYNDTTMSSDTSDVEGRVEMLAEKLAERRIEMAKLRRETRKQAKRRLKALELNLLNQIKKYDATINEMQMKLESQKGAMRESDKLAIESRSVADFKVPEIPLKRIQELYKSSDLLRSRSESDLIFSKTSNTRTSENYCGTDAAENDSVYKASSLRDHIESRSSKNSSTRELRTNHSVESVLEEARKFASSNAEKHSDGTISDRESCGTNVGKSHESVHSEDATEHRTVSSPRPDETEIFSDGTKSGYISEHVNTAESEGNSELFSRKLETLHLTNKNLNADISTLENDLKALSDIMSQFSKKSDNKLKADSQRRSTEAEEIHTCAESSSKSTLRDVSEDITKSVHTETTNESVDHKISARAIDSIPETSIIEEIREKSRTSGSPTIRDELIDAVAELVSTGTNPEEKSSIAKSPEDIDFEARSKEILNVIEKSIISEHIETADRDTTMSEADLERSMIDMCQENEELSQDLNSLEGDIKSISQMISKMAESKRSLEIDRNSCIDSYRSKEERDTLRGGASPILHLASERLAIIAKENDESRVTPEKDSTDEIRSEITSDPISANETPRESSDRTNTLESHEIQDGGDKIVSHDACTRDAESEKLNEREDCESIEEEISERENSRHDESAISRKSVDISNEFEQTDNRTNESSLENLVNEMDEENCEISHGIISAENEWTLSDSFQVPEKAAEDLNDCEKSFQPEASISVVPSEMSVMNFSEEESRLDPGDETRSTQNFSCNVDNVSMFLPKGESTALGYRFEESLIKTTKSDTSQIDELDDILDIIARESEQNDDASRALNAIPKAENETSMIVNEKIGTTNVSDERMIPRPTDLNLTAEVEPVLQKLTEILQGVERNIALRRKKGNEDVPKIDIEELATPDPPSEIASKILSPESDRLTHDDTNPEILGSMTRVIREDSLRDSIIEDAQSPESLSCPRESLEKSSQNHELDKSPVNGENSVHDCAVKLAERTFDILRDPEYEDISEESLEVSEILDRSESQRSSLSRNKRIPDKYEVKQKSEDVLRILDEISQKSYKSNANEAPAGDVRVAVQAFGSVSPGVGPNERIVIEGSVTSVLASIPDDVKSVEVEIVASKELTNRDKDSSEVDRNNANAEQNLSENVEAPGREISEKRENDASSDSSEGADTPRGVSEIEMDSPRDPNESRLDIDALDDDLLSIGDATKSSSEPKVEFPGMNAIVSSEKDIETMIDKLKASLEQPGLEVAELEAKLLRIEQLQIELEIKKLEAEEVSYYMREIPNKPPPPYTPPSGGRLLTPQASPTLPPAVVPTNVEELTAFTEKATVMIFNAKNAGLDITSLEPPSEIFHISNGDANEASKQDRRIYNTFLFDLCKETIAELYRSEYEKPGPSWSKPSVKTKPAMKIPKTIEELNDYVSKEVATLFGFKTKLQRENMVMRWSRKRRDRVDELLAREAQAEEDEWTKFHHDELAVKNELTVAILDTLILETANCVKAVYAKKRRVVA